MSQQTINAGHAANDSTNDILRGHLDKADANFSELYASVAAAQADATSALTFRGALVRKSADQTGANYTSASVVIWDAEDYDTDDFHDNSTNNSRLTVPAGVSWVRLGAQIRTGNVATTGTTEILEIRKNGASFPAGAYDFSTDENPGPALNIWTAVIPVVEGDYFEARLQITGDTSVDIRNDSWFAIEAAG